MQENLLLAVFALGPLVAGVALYLFFRRFRLHRPTSRRLLRLLAGNLLVLLFLGALALLGGELYYRFGYDTTDSFAQAKVTRRWFERYYQMNKKGVRDSVDDYPAKPPPGQRRVTFLGDSFTVGHGVADVADRFANRIRRMRPEWDVQVFARNGFDTGMHLAMLDNVAQWGTYQFDQVVLVYCVNDISDMIKPWQDKLLRISSQPPPGYLVEHSYLINTLYYRFKAASDPDLADYYRCVLDGYSGPLWDQQRARLAEIKNRVHALGGRLSVVTFPFLHTLGPENRYRPIHRKLDDFWQSLGVPHLDLLEFFEAHRSEDLMVNPRDPHPNEHAHQLASEPIEKFIAQQLNVVSAGSPATAP